MNNEKYKNDLMFLQNEILGDIKNVENKLDNKINKTSESIAEQKSYFERKIIHLENIINTVKKATQNVNKEKSNEEEIAKFNALSKKVEDYYSKLDEKITTLNSEMENASYQNEKTMMNYLRVPYLIGEKCPYSSPRDFFENIHKKINDLFREKDRQNADFKKYKEKTEKEISQNKSYLPLFETRVNKLITLLIKDLDNQHKEKLEAIEKKINEITNENSHTFTKIYGQLADLNDRFTGLSNTIKKSLAHYKEELDKIKISIEDINLKLIKNEEQTKNFEEKIKLIDELNEKIKLLVKMMNNDNIFDNKNNEEKNYSPYKKGMFEIYEEIKNKSNVVYSRNNIYEKEKNISKYNLIDGNNEEIDNYVTNSRQNINREDINIFNRLNLNDKTKISLRKGNSNNNILKNNSKKKNLFNSVNESSDRGRINNIFFDAEFFKRSNYLANSFLNDYYNQNYRIKRPKKIYNHRINSSKFFHQLPFSTGYMDNNNINEEQLNFLNSRNNYMEMNSQKSVPGENDLNDNAIFDNYTLYGNSNTFGKKLDLDSSDIYLPPNRKFAYLDKKIEILGNVMVDTLNKIIYQVN